MKQLIEHPIPISQSKFWKDVFFAPGYVQAEHLEGLQCVEYKEIEACSGPPSYNRTLFSVPPLNIPRKLQKLVGSRIGYTEKGHFDTPTQRYVFTLTPTLMPKKISISGWYEILPVDSYSVIRRCSLEFSVSVFGLGKQMEGVIAQSNLNIQQKTAAFSARWIADNGL